MTKRKKLPPYDWRRVEAALRARPGIWHDLPADLPMLNPRRVRDGAYRSAFDSPGAFEVEGWQRGMQRARFVGEADPMPFFLGDVASLDDLPRRVPVDAWRDEAASWAGPGPGFTTLPLEAARRPVLALAETPAEPRGDDLPTIALAGRSHWPDVAATLREHPGSWFRVLGRWSSYAAQIKRGTLVAFRPVGAWEARTRDYELEVRYVGEGGER